MEGARSGGIGLGGTLVILGIVLAIVWSFWWGLIIGLVGLIFFGGFARGRWYWARRQTAGRTHDERNRSWNTNTIRVGRTSRAKAISPTSCWEEKLPRGKAHSVHPGWRDVGAAGSGVDTASRLDTDTAQVLGNA